MCKGPEVGETMGVTGKCLSIGNPRRNRTLQVAPLQSSLRETCGAPSPTFGRNPVLLGGASPPSAVVPGQRAPGTLCYRPNACVLPKSMPPDDGIQRGGLRSCVGLRTEPARMGSGPQ